MKKRVLVFAAAVLSLLAVTVLLLDEAPVDAVPEEVQVAPALPVTVVAVPATDNSGSITSYAEVRPRWHANMTAQVSGTLLKLSTHTRVGQQVTAGQPLLRIEDTRLRAAFSDAERTLAAAQLELATQRRRAEVLANDRKTLGKHGGDALALNKPQVRAAQMAVRAAIDQRAVAQLDLDAAQVKAPFDGVITARHVSPGQRITAGQQLLTIKSHTELDVELRLSEHQWQQLKPGADARLHPVDNPDRSVRASARGGAGRSSGHRDPATRQHVLMLAIDPADSGADLMGSYVAVSLPTSARANSYAVPISALTADGQVWLLDDDDRLWQTAVEVLFHRQQLAIVRPMLAVDKRPIWRVVSHALSSYMSGAQTCALDDEAGHSACTP